MSVVDLGKVIGHRVLQVRKVRREFRGQRVRKVIPESLSR